MAAESVCRKLISDGPTATEDLGAALAHLAQPGWVVALDGDLGSGKTCFVRGFARGMGVVEPVSSPTFTLMHEYPGRLTVYHLDAWMQERGEAFLEDGGDEWLRAEGVALVEWADRLDRWLPADRLRVRLAHLGPEQRSIELECTDATSEPAAALARLVLPEGLREAP